MLFWSFVLAFVLSVLYYMSPVHNTVQIEDKPLSDSLVATFVNAHQAAKRLTYMDRGALKTVNKQCDDPFSDGTIDCLDNNGNPIPIEVEDTSQRVITFTYKKEMQKLKPGGGGSSYLSPDTASSTRDASRAYSDGALAYIDTSVIRKFLPGDKKFDEYVYYNGLRSAFVCITNVGGSGTTVEPYLTFDCQGGKGAGNLIGEEKGLELQKAGIGDYVLTYMSAPDSEVSQIAHAELWRSGVLRRTKGSHECGVLWYAEGGQIEVSGLYQYENGDIKRDEEGNPILYNHNILVPKRKKYDETSNYILDNSRRFTVSVPKRIGEVLSADSVIRSDMKSGYLLFCITPMDDIRGSFENKCDRGYGRYTIKDYMVSKGTEEITVNEVTIRDVSDCSKKP